MINPENKRPVSVEDLLRLKRAERPPAEFWVRFERELRAKQLAAIVEKRPWWTTAMPRLFAGLKRYQVPLGASAILAVTFVSVRHYQTPAPAPHPVPAAPSVEVAAIAETPTLALNFPAPAIVVAEVSELPAAPVVVAAVEENSANAEPMVLSASTSPGRLSEMVPWLGHEQAEPEAVGVPAVQALYAANLATVKATHPELARRFLGEAGGSENKVVATHKVTDPMARMRGPSDYRRERLLASAPGFAGNTSVSGMKNGERIARRLSEDRLTEEAISRVKVGGDRFSFKM